MQEAPFSPAEYADLLLRPPSEAAQWNAFSLWVVDDPPPSREVTLADHVISLRLSGPVRFAVEVNGNIDRGWSTPGCINVSPAKITHTARHHKISGAYRVVLAFIPDAFLSRVIAENWDVEPRTVELVRRLAIRDPVIEGVLTSLATEATNHSPSGRLYAESACDFLAHHLARRYSSLSTDSRTRGGLSGFRLKQVVEYIHDNLGRSVGVRELAEIAGTSPRHFERAFRQAMGVAPYLYVTQERVAAARDLLLADRALSIGHIARRTGFGSSSRLATAFRRQTGYSPAAFRRLAP